MGAFSSGTPAVIDFYATWCGPCKILYPLLERLAWVFKDEIRVHKVNVDDESELAEELGVVSVPTLIFIRKNHEQWRTVGAISWRKLCASVWKLLGDEEMDRDRIEGP